MDVNTTHNTSEVGPDWGTNINLTKCTLQTQTKNVQIVLISKWATYHVSCPPICYDMYCSSNDKRTNKMKFKHWKRYFQQRYVFIERELSPISNKWINTQELFRCISTVCGFNLDQGTAFHLTISISLRIGTHTKIRMGILYKVDIHNFLRHFQWNQILFSNDMSYVPT